MKRGAAVATGSVAQIDPVAGGLPASIRLVRCYGPVIGPPLVVLLAVLALWQFLWHQPQVPAPGNILGAMGANRDVILSGMRVTFWEEALRGYLAGCGLGFAAGVLCSRFEWLRRGLVPYAVLSNSIPIIAFSPVMVFWFGFEWPSKAAVVLVMTFFPMLINTAVGLTSYAPLSRDLLTSYAAGGWTVFAKLEFPAALPMVFNGLKICSTLSIIGATVAEYFSSLGKGLGSQIQEGAQVAAWDLVWACVVVACLMGVLFYAVLLLLERLATFWHVSYRAQA